MQNLFPTLVAVVVVLSVAAAGIVAAYVSALSVGLIVCAAVAVRLYALRGE